MFFTNRATAGIKISQQVILMFVAPQGRHDSLISVKFGTTEETDVGRRVFGFSGPQKTKNCQLFRPARANPLPDVGEIGRVYAGNRSTKLLTFGA